MIKLILTSKRIMGGLILIAIAIIMTATARPSEFPELEPRNKVDWPKYYLTAGAILLVIGIADVARKIRMGVTGAGEITELKNLDARIESQFSWCMDYARNCFKIYGILVSTRYRLHHDRFRMTNEDKIWKRARKLALESAEKGYNDCDRLLKITVEYPRIVLLREIFLHVLETCHDCPIIHCKGHEVASCPIVELFDRREM